jgi:hypothetical protein
VPIRLLLGDPESEAVARRGAGERCTRRPSTTRSSGSTTTCWATRTRTARWRGSRRSCTSAGSLAGTIVFVFDGGTLSADRIDALQLTDDELSGFRLCTTAEASELLRDVWRRRQCGRDSRDGKITILPPRRAARMMTAPALARIAAPGARLRAAARDSLHPPAHNVTDCLRRGIGVLVLPNAYDAPAGGAKRRIVATVAGDVAIELRAPIRAVGPRRHAVLGAPVPEAPVEKDGQTRGRKDHICSTRHVGCWLAVLEEPKSATMQRRPQGNLGARVAASVALHDNPCLRRARRRRPRQRRKQVAG